MLKANGFDKAVIGRGRRCGKPDVLVYDIDKCIKILAKQAMAQDPNLSEEEAFEQAEEYLEFNSIGAWVGEETPVWVQRETMKQIDEEESENQEEGDHEPDDGDDDLEDEDDGD